MSVPGIQSASPRVSALDDRPVLREKPAGGEVFAAQPQSAVGKDEATFSAEALERSRHESEPETSEAGSGNGESAGAGKLTDEEQEQVRDLRARDAEVRTHEAAHMAAGGAHVRGGATYTYQQGPDGKSYAIGGEVGIDVSSVSGNPQATIQKMQQVRAAAMAPAEPSGADRAVAAAASQVEAQAREKLAAQNNGAADRIATRYAASTEPKTGSVIDTAA